jgi:hypothetical protein
MSVYEKELPEHWEYIGDINLEYGGTFFKVDDDNTRYGYMDAVRVTDLESATGADGLYLIEAITVIGFNEKDKVQNGLGVCGWLDDEHWRGKGKKTVLLAVADGLMSYGYYDPQNRFPYHHTAVVVHRDSYFGNKASWDGWEVDKQESVSLHKDYTDDLFDYVVSEWLD